MNNNNTTYKDSPLGKIPCDWEVNTLGVLTEKIGSGITPRGGEKVYKLTGRPFLRSQNVGWGTLILDDVVFIDEGTHKSFQSTEIKDGDVFLNITGASIGRTAISIKSVIGGNVNQHVCIIRSDRNLLNPSYLNSFLLSKQGQNLIDSYQAGGNRQGLNFEQIRSFKLPLPSLPEQKAIAQLLSTWDVAISKTQTLIAQKELQKKWLMQNLLTGKKRLLNDELGIINDKWKTIKLGDVFEFVKSYSISREGLTKSYKENLIFCIHYGDIHAFYETDFLDFSNQQSIPQIIEEAQIIYEKDYLKEGDIIMADASEDYKGVGEVVEVINLENKIAVGGLHTIVLRANSEIFARIFCGYFFSCETVRNALRKVATGTSVYSVTKSQIHNLSFIIPNSLKEQTAIAQVLQAADKEIQLLKTKTEKLREQKKGLMQVLLTGKKRLCI